MNELEKFRKEIDEVDDAILENLSKRMDIIERLYEYKRKNNLSIVSEDRKNKMEKRWLIKKLNLTPSFLRRFLIFIHNESVSRQFQKFNEENNEK